MHAAEQARKAEIFRSIHRRPSLPLPKPWNAISARLFAAAGFPAITTTSGGVSWAIGYADGDAAPWPEVVAATARIVRVVPVPVTADIAAGFGETPQEVGNSVVDIIRAGSRRQSSAARPISRPAQTAFTRSGCATRPRWLGW